MTDNNSQNPKRDWTTINRAKDERLTFRLSREHKQEFIALAEKLGVTYTDLFLSRVFSIPLPRKAKRPPIEVKTLSRLQGHIGSIGNNLNQMARLMNSGIMPNMDEVRAELAELRKIRLEIKAALGKTTIPTQDSINLTDPQ